jgi:hypothetical protein
MPIYDLASFDVAAAGASFGANLAGRNRAAAAPTLIESAAGTDDWNAIAAEAQAQAASQAAAKATRSTPSKAKGTTL